MDGSNTHNVQNQQQDQATPIPILVPRTALTPTFKIPKPRKYISDLSKLDEINRDIVRSVEFQVLDRTRSRIADAIEDHMQSIVYKRDFLSVLKEILASFRSARNLISAEILTKIFDQLPTFPQAEKYTILREIRNRLDYLFRHHTSKLRTITLKHFQVWLIIEQERFKSVNHSKLPWYETEASSSNRLKIEVDSVYGFILSELKDNLLVKVRKAVAAHLQEEDARKARQAEFLEQRRQWMTQSLGSLTLQPSPENELAGDMMGCTFRNSR